MTNQPQKKQPAANQPANQSPPAWCYMVPFAGLFPQCTVNTGNSVLPPPSKVITEPAVNAANNAANSLVGSAEQAALNAILQPLLDSLHTIGIKIGVFMFGLMLVIVGFWIVTSG